MSFDVCAFTKAFPEFADENKYSPETMEYWAAVADLQFNISRWGTLATHGKYLFVAHNIALSAQAVAAANKGLDVSRGTGLISSKGVDGVSVSYDNGAIVENDGGNYNLTRYGRELLRLARIKGIGGLQLLTASVDVASLYD